MTKLSIDDLAHTVQSKHQISASQAQDFVKAMFDVVTDHLDEHSTVKIKGLGTFKVQSVKDRESVDVNTGDRIVIEGRNKVTFTPDNALRDYVNRPFAQFETVVLNDGVDFTAIDARYEQPDEDDEAPEKPAEPARKEEKKTVGMVEINMQDVVRGVEESFHDSPTKQAIAELESLLDGDFPAPGAPDDDDDDDDEIPIADEDDDSELIDEETEKPKEEAVATEKEPASAVEKAHEPAPEPQPAPEKLAAESPVEATEEQPEADAEELPAEDENAKGQLSEPERATFEPQKPPFEEPKGPLSQTDSAAPIGHPTPTTKASDSYQQTEAAVKSHRKLITVLLTMVVVLFVGMVYLAYGYGKLAAQRDMLLQMQTQMPAKTAKAPVPAATTATPAAAQPAKAEAPLATEAPVTEEPKAAEPTAEAVPAPAPAAETKAQAAKPEPATEPTSRYDSDPRIRYGAYRIVGVAKEVKVRPGQTLARISRTHLGPGMECYMEALNGTGELKAGQTVKIPQLKLKRK